MEVSRETTQTEEPSSEKRGAVLDFPTSSVERQANCDSNSDDSLSKPQSAGKGSGADTQGISEGTSGGDLELKTCSSSCSDPVPSLGTIALDQRGCSSPVKGDGTTASISNMDVEGSSVATVSATLVSSPPGESRQERSESTSHSGAAVTEDLFHGPEIHDLQVFKMSPKVDDDCDSQTVLNRQHEKSDDVHSHKKTVNGPTGDAADSREEDETRSPCSAEATCGDEGWQKQVEADSENGNLDRSTRKETSLSADMARDRKTPPLKIDRRSNTPPTELQDGKSSGSGLEDSEVFADLALDKKTPTVEIDRRSSNPPDLQDGDCSTRSAREEAELSADLEPDRKTSPKEIDSRASSPSTELLDEEHSKISMRKEPKLPADEAPNGKTAPVEIANRASISPIESLNVDASPKPSRELSDIAHDGKTPPVEIGSRASSPSTEHQDVNPLASSAREESELSADMGPDRKSPDVKIESRVRNPSTELQDVGSSTRSAREESEISADMEPDRKTSPVEIDSRSSIPPIERQDGDLPTNSGREQSELSINIAPDGKKPPVETDSRASSTSAESQGGDHAKGSVREESELSVGLVSGRKPLTVEIASQAINPPTELQDGDLSTKSGQEKADLPADMTPDKETTSFEIDNRSSIPPTEPQSGNPSSRPLREKSEFSDISPDGKISPVANDGPASSPPAGLQDKNPSSGLAREELELSADLEENRKTSPMEIDGRSTSPAEPQDVDPSSRSTRENPELSTDSPPDMKTPPAETGGRSSSQPTELQEGRPVSDDQTVRNIQEINDQSPFSLAQSDLDAGPDAKECMVNENQADSPTDFGDEHAATEKELKTSRGQNQVAKSTSSDAPQLGVESQLQVAAELEPDVERGRELEGTPQDRTLSTSESAGNCEKTSDNTLSVASGQNQRPKEQHSGFDEYFQCDLESGSRTVQPAEGKFLIDGKPVVLRSVSIKVTRISLSDHLMSASSLGSLCRNEQRGQNKLRDRKPRRNSGRSSPRCGSEERELKKRSKASRKKQRLKDIEERLHSHERVERSASEESFAGFPKAVPYGKPGCDTYQISKKAQDKVARLSVEEYNPDWLHHVDEVLDEVVKGDMIHAPAFEGHDVDAPGSPHDSGREDRRVRRSSTKKEHHDETSSCLPPGMSPRLCLMRLTETEIRSYQKKMRKASVLAQPITSKSNTSHPRTEHKGSSPSKDRPSRDTGKETWREKTPSRSEPCRRRVSREADVPKPELSDIGTENAEVEKSHLNVTQPSASKSNTSRPPTERKGSSPSKDRPSRNTAKEARGEKTPSRSEPRKNRVSRGADVQKPELSDLGTGNVEDEESHLNVMQPSVSKSNSSRPPTERKGSAPSKDRPSRNTAKEAHREKTPSRSDSCKRRVSREADVQKPELSDVGTGNVEGEKNPLNVTLPSPVKSPHSTEILESLSKRKKIESLDAEVVAQELDFLESADGSAAKKSDVKAGWEHAEKGFPEIPSDDGDDSFGASGIMDVLDDVVGSGNSPRETGSPSPFATASLTTEGGATKMEAVLPDTTVPDIPKDTFESLMRPSSPIIPAKQDLVPSSTVDNDLVVSCSSTTPQKSEDLPTSAQVDEKAGFEHKADSTTPKVETFEEIDTPKKTYSIFVVHEDALPSIASSLTEEIAPLLAEDADAELQGKTAGTSAPDQRVLQSSEKLQMEEPSKNVTERFSAEVLPASDTVHDSEKQNQAVQMKEPSKNLRESPSTEVLPASDSVHDTGNQKPAVQVEELSKSVKECSSTEALPASDTVRDTGKEDKEAVKRTYGSYKESKADKKTRRKFRVHRCIVRLRDVRLSKSHRRLYKKAKRFMKTGELADATKQTTPDLNVSAGGASHEQETFTDTGSGHRIEHEGEDPDAAKSAKSTSDEKKPEDEGKDSNTAKSVEPTLDEKKSKDEGNDPNAAKSVKPKPDEKKCEDEGKDPNAAKSVKPTLDEKKCEDERKDPNAAKNVKPTPDEKKSEGEGKDPNTAKSVKPTCDEKKLHQTEERSGDVASGTMTVKKDSKSKRILKKSEAKTSHQTRDNAFASALMSKAPPPRLPKKHPRYDNAHNARPLETPEERERRKRQKLHNIEQRLRDSSAVAQGSSLLDTLLTSTKAPQSRDKRPSKPEAKKDQPKVVSTLIENTLTERRPPVQEVKPPMYRASGWVQSETSKASSADVPHGQSSDVTATEHTSESQAESSELHRKAVYPQEEPTIAAKTIPRKTRWEPVSPAADASVPRKTRWDPVSPAADTSAPRKTRWDPVSPAADTSAPRKTRWDPVSPAADSSAPRKTRWDPVSPNADTSAPRKTRWDPVSPDAGASVLDKMPVIPEWVPHLRQDRIGPRTPPMPPSPAASPATSPVRSSSRCSDTERAPSVHDDQHSSSPPADSDTAQVASSDHVTERAPSREGSGPNPESEERIANDTEPGTPGHEAFAQHNDRAARKRKRSEDDQDLEAMAPKLLSREPTPLKTTSDRADSGTGVNDEGAQDAPYTPLGDPGWDESEGEANEEDAPYSPSNSPMLMCDLKNIKPPKRSRKDEKQEKPKEVEKEHKEPDPPKKESPKPLFNLRALKEKAKLLSKSRTSHGDSVEKPQARDDPAREEAAPSAVDFAGSIGGLIGKTPIAETALTQKCTDKVPVEAHEVAEARSASPSPFSLADYLTGDVQRAHKQCSAQSPKNPPATVASGDSGHGLQKSSLGLLASLKGKAKSLMGSVLPVAPAPPSISAAGVDRDDIYSFGCAPARENRARADAGYTRDQWGYSDDRRPFEGSEEQHFQDPRYTQDQWGYHDDPQQYEGSAEQRYEWQSSGSRGRHHGGRY